MTALAAPRVAAPAAGAAFVVRLGTFCALALFGALHWAAIVRPSEGGKLFAMLVVALGAGLVLPSAAEARGRWRRTASVAGVLLAALAAILLAAGTPLGVLRPDRWGTLAARVGAGIVALPALRIPYAGVDPWVRIVLLGGGGLLLAGAACVALAPRPRTFAAAVCLGTLYSVPVVERAPRHPYLDGMAFALLLGAFLLADRLSQREAPLAAGLALAAVLGAAIAAPHVASGRPWIDYQALAEALQAGKSTTFRWNHRYGPLNWPRDGLELARVRSARSVYLKTAALEEFDGFAWRQTRNVLASGDDTETDPRHPGWTQTIHVTMKGLRSEEFLGAGTTTSITQSTREVREATPGTFETAARPLRRGDSYDARVYVPQPDPAELHQAGLAYPPFVARQLAVELPAQLGPQVGAIQIDLAPWGSGRATTARGAHGFVLIDPDAALRASRYRRTYALAGQLRAASTDPYDFVGKVIARVQRGARYTESPPPPGRRAPLDAFLFDGRAGYCQHFAGATALLLRLGGVPARVAAGFSPGLRSGPDQVVSDLDAHSWVEVYFPRLGWVTFDPTPSDSPARSQLTDTQRRSAAAPGNRRRARAAGDRVSDPTAGGAVGGAGGQGETGRLAIAAAALLAAAVAAMPVLAVRRRRRLARSGDAEIEELRLALLRSGRAAPPDLTLRRVEQLLGGSDGALGYLRALRLARYGAGAPPPTAAQRRALRRELAAGLGLRGRLRSLWALPPRPRELADALRLRRPSAR